jgi:hypothetical protein
MDPNPIKHVGSIMKRLRSELDADLLSAGFVFDGECIPFPRPYSKSVDFARPGMFLSLSFNNHYGKLTAEAINDDGHYYSVADVILDGVRTTSEIIPLLNAFVARVRQFLVNLPSETK